RKVLVEERHIDIAGHLRHVICKKEATYAYLSSWTLRSAGSVGIKSGAIMLHGMLLNALPQNGYRGLYGSMRGREIYLTSGPIARLKKVRVYLTNGFGAKSRLQHEGVSIKARFQP
ncbi:hypothetical protein OS493_011256, partial [Desmophyllum pertusum]